LGEKVACKLAFLDHFGWVGLGVNHCFRRGRKNIFVTGINDLLSMDQGKAVAETTGMNGGNNGQNREDAGVLILLCSDL
jgi:hypothetical protein